VDTNHRVAVGDARRLPLADESVQLVVTSPPYPMVEMWDDAFTGLAPEAGVALADGDGRAAFDAMHDVLDGAWRDIERVLEPGGIACLNVGDATRTIAGDFRLYPNHARVLEGLQDVGLTPLPDILWRKPTNSAAKFMGSGTRPPNAYVTLEHEYILVARKGGLRRPDPDLRDRSAFFWEERNEWFSDVWTFTGQRQAGAAGSRDRTGAFPLDLPYRLVNMYSVQGDTVLDPFWGTGTTTRAAMCSARNSVGVELDPGLASGFDPSDVAFESRARSRARLEAHHDFVSARDEPPGYEATHYDTRVVTKGERNIRLPVATDVHRTATGWTVEHDWL
jgi:site-specific DNA-methyltransferase (adenine-specific)